MSQLVASWAARWGALGAVTMSEPVLLAWRVTHLPDSAVVASITGRLTNTVFSTSILQNGSVLWSTSVSLFTLALWISGPPLVLLWLSLWEKRREAVAHASRQRSAGLSDGTRADGIPADERPRQRVR